MKKVVCVAIHQNMQLQVAVFDESQERIARVYAKQVAGNLREGNVILWKAERIKA